MKQVIQNFKTGQLYVDDVPIPSLSDNMVLVQNSFSLISAGTERSTVKVAKSNLLGKARQRPDLVAQVLNNIRKEGLKATLDKVRTKLDSLKALGYSTSGKVLASMDSNSFFKAGDRVACAGQDYASHAEVVCIPQNLIAKIPDNVTDEEASFTTLGAIALQGVRQADVKLGEVVCVIGLGLLGQLTCQLLIASGCKVMGIDMSAHMLDLAIQNGADEAILRSDANLNSRIDAFTNGHGFDSVIITAASPTNDPIVLAGEITRKKGKVIAVGAVKLDVPRDPHYYKKELDLRLSMSYGPGRYDVNYEEHGVDYPFAYVRWTEQRNMEAFLQILSQKKINVKPLISHVFDISEAESAYKIVMGEVKEPHIAILLSYPDTGKVPATLVPLRSEPAAAISVGFIGAGSFAQSYLIPHVKKSGGSLQTVVTSRGITAKNVAQKFGFNNASSEIADILLDKSVNTVFIATPHNLHAPYTLEALKAGKNVFVEKPLAMNDEELEAVRAYYTANGGNLLVGFNRRFAPVSVELKQLFRNLDEPLVMNYRVNAGFIPKEHWIQNEQTGGGRIIGEVCHFIDLMQYFTGSVPVNVYASCISTESEKVINRDNIVITLTFKNGSVGTITYVANGNKLLPKERLEIFGGGHTAVINDFRSGEIYSNGKLKKIKVSGKGHNQEVEAFLEGIKAGTMPISFESIYYTTKATFRIIDSLITNLPQNIE